MSGVGLKSTFSSFRIAIMLFEKNEFEFFFLAVFQFSAIKKFR